MTEIGCQTYSLRRFKLGVMLEDVRKAGFRSIELWAGHADHARGEAGAADVRAAVELMGLEIAAYSVGGFVRAPLTTVAARLEAAFAYARALDVELLTGVVDRRAVPVVEALCRRTRLRFGIENHWYADFARPRDYERALATVSPLVGATLDTGHLALAGGDPVAAVDALGERLFAVHLKDVAPRSRWARLLPRRRRLVGCTLGTGTLDLEGFLRALADGRFAGSLVIEDERPEPPLSELQAALRVASQAMRVVNGNGTRPEVR
jgi:sugar phosphate isomerase/epimerase